MNFTVPIFDVKNLNFSVDDQNIRQKG